jgi:diguanylate cyclase (GGDEF)-like protein/PAS domain S-box-containing protein
MSNDLIICVDDEPSIINSLRTELFNAFGDEYMYEFASSSEEALEIIDDSIEDNIEIPLIISDCIMPGMRGDELLIKVHQILPNTKTIMLTGQADMENIKNAINKANLYRYLEKPWEKKDLKLTIHEALKSYYDNKELIEYQKELEKKIAQRTQDIQEYMSIIDKYIITSTTDTKGIITYASRAFCKITGYTKDELVGQPHNIVRHPDMSSDVFAELWKTIKSGKVWQGEVKNRAKDGSEYWVENTISPILRDNKIVGYSSIRQNITAKKMIEEIAITDELTKLHNRRYFNDIFTKEVMNSKEFNKPLAFVIFDIDFFKNYNDHYGHQDGDNALKIVAKAIKDSINSSKTVSYTFRLGGEEFGILIANQNLNTIKELSEKVRKDIENTHIEHKKSSVNEYITVSIGVYYNNGNSIDNEDDIYRLADEALYRAKSSGRNRVEIYTK